MQVPPQGPQPEQTSTPPCPHEHPQAAAGANLQALCSDTVFDSLSQQQLDDMPPLVLAQLLRDCAAQRKELKRRLADAEQEVQECRKRNERRYIVDPLAWDDRVDRAMKDRVEAVVSKWHRRLRHHTEPEDSFESSSMEKGNKGKPEIVYDSKLQTLKLLSAEEVKNVDYYKSVWAAEVVHRASGHILGCGEHKGAAGVYLHADHPNRQFVEDGVELINLLCDPRCPHPYDGTVAGSVA